MTTTAAHTTAYYQRLSPRRVKVTLMAVMGGLFVAGLDATVVSTAMPTVVAELQGIDHYAWVFTAFLVCETVTIPFWGKVADLVGRKRTFLTGIAIFVIASALCGAAQSMMQLVIFRGIQGVGGGCLVPVAQTIAADLFTVEQRAKIVALFSGVFAISSVIGPFVGGFLTDQLSWRWVFFVNLPVGLVVGTLILVILIEPLEERIPHRFDWLGMALLGTATSSLLVALAVGGREYEWGSPFVVGCLVASAVLTVSFVAHERRATEPIIPLDLFRIRAVASATAVSALLGATLFGVGSFLPLFLQTVTGSSATAAGRSLTPLMLAYVAASFVGGRLLLRTGYRRVLLLGLLVTGTGIALLLGLDANSTRGEVQRDVVFIGFGMGLSLISTILPAQNAVAQRQMGTTTSTLNFTRMIGGAIGVAMAGAVLLNSLLGRLEKAFPGQEVSASRLLGGELGGASLSPEAQAAVREAFAGALHQVFVTMAVIAVITLLVACTMPARQGAALGRARTDLATEVAMAAGTESAPAEVGAQDMDDIAGRDDRGRRAPPGEAAGA